ncbi:LacI family DNA-binding transcriptional regulator [Metabacillus herbersteinensis]|uniref:LacI family DNA-binding transcriptional regulator n=1 Tax=Metabacillus herbersteinensis TaxID=283816 RepID=A0ABV6GAD0_9BACI
MDKKKVTALDVAKMAGVSQPTVSRVFGTGANVSEKKRKSILEAAKELGYQPNAIARGLITNKTKIIGIVMRNVQNPFYPEVLDRFYTQLANKGYYLLFINSENEQIQEKEISQLIEYNVEGVIITDASLSSTAADRFARNGKSVVLFNRYIKDTQYSAVFCDNYSAGYDIGTMLVEKGHKNLAFISGPPNTSTTIDRKKGFEKALLAAGITSFPVVNGEYSYEGGFKAAQKLLLEHKNIDGIFCGNDISAFGVVDAVRKLGFKIPEDLSIVGFDDVKMSSWSSYSLTTWKQPIKEMVEAAVSILLNSINSGHETPTIQSLKGELILRDSVSDRR